MNATVSVRDEVAGKMLFSAYPHRKAGGRWLAAGWHYASDFDRKLEEKWKRYSVNGEYGTEIQTFRGAQRFGLRAYDTMLGGFDYKTDKTLQWFYELLTDIPPEQSGIRRRTHDLRKACGASVRGASRRASLAFQQWCRQTPAASEQRPRLAALYAVRRQRSDGGHFAGNRSKIPVCRRKDAIVRRNSAVQQTI